MILYRYRKLKYLFLKCSIRHHRAVPNSSPYSNIIFSQSLTFFFFARGHFIDSTTTALVIGAKKLLYYIAFKIGRLQRTKTLSSSSSGFSSLFLVQFNRVITRFLPECDLFVLIVLIKRQLNYIYYENKCVTYPGNVYWYINWIRKSSDTNVNIFNLRGRHIHARCLLLTNVKHNKFQLGISNFMLLVSILE